MKYISLGYACDTAHQIRRITKQTEAYPFDWLITPFPALVTLLQTRFERFLRIEDLERNNKGHVFDKKLDVYFLHDFNREDEISNVIANVRAKYERRIKRFFDIVGSGEPITFVRSRQYDDDGALSLPEAEQLVELLSQMPGAGNFKIIGVNVSSTTRPDETSERATVVTVPETRPFVWSGDDVRWETILAPDRGSR